MLDNEEFSKLVTTMFSAAIGQASWRDFLADLMRVSGGVNTHLLGFDQEAGIAMGVELVGYDPDFVKTYDDHFATRNPWAPGFAAHDPGVVVDCENMCRNEDVLKTDFYHDWLRPQEDITQGGGALLFKSDSRFFALGGNIRARDADKIKGKWLGMVGQLVPHLQQAFEISRALEAQKLETTIVAAHGLRDVPGIVLLSESGRIVFANPVAQAMLGVGHPIAVDRRGFLSIAAAQSKEHIRQAYSRHLFTGSRPSFSIEVPSERPGTAYQLRFAAFSPEAGIALPLDATLGISGRCTLLVITENGAASDHVTLLQQQRGLTKAEAEVAMLVAEGLSSRQISDLREVSIHTVRHQIKAVLAKLDVHRQTDIVRLMQEYSATGDIQ